ncbi:MAG: hypothetical protein JNK50_08675 [Bacteroidia bacterium]|nr:hypothetical protein [Bacteroidia bacterium]
MKLNTLLSFSLLLMVSCTGQNSHTVETTYNTTPPTIADTVKNLSNNIMITYQDKKNNYWFGSWEDGLYKYDGKVILHYTKKSGLSNISIRGIQEDKAGNIYITTLDRIHKFNGQFFSTLNVIESSPLNSNWRLNPDDLWFTALGKNGVNGPCRYDGENLYQLTFPKHFMADEYYEKYPNNPWSPYDVYYTYKDQKGHLWFGTSNFGLCRYDGQSISWLYEDHLTNTPNGGSFGIRSIIEDKNGKFWFCNTKYRYSIFSDTKKEMGASLINYQREKGIGDIKSNKGVDFIYFLSAIEDNNGNLWLVTYDEGVWCYNGTSTKHYPVKKDELDVKLFSIYKDIKGDLWLGTQNDGVYKFNGRDFEKFVP